MAVKLSVAIILLISGYAKAQAPVHIDLMTDMWDKINLTEYRLDAKKNTYAYFPQELASLNNKVIELPGYMLPIKAGLTHFNFMLSVLPVLQCQFCGQGDVPPMIEVQLLKGLPYSEKPIVIKGTLVLNSTDKSKPEISVIKASAAEFK